MPGDGMRMGEGLGMEYGCAHENEIAGNKCSKCGQRVPGSPDSCEEHRQMLPGEKCAQCDWVIPCPQCGVAGNIGVNGCMNCGWGARVASEV
jgi:hypothetical protein